MRKSLIATVLTLFVCSTFSCVFAANYTKFSSKFVKNFKDCDKYEETTTSESDGTTFTTNRRILGWRNGFCKYEETFKTNKNEYKVNCSFTSVQVDELYDAMKSRSKELEKYELETFAESKDPKTGKTKYISTGTQTIKGNKAYIAWAKYQNNPYFCSPQKVK
ncbi:hypothetical protein IJ541_11025 [bacterium]|nr:hypothetical protein [bacterium]